MRHHGHQLLVMVSPTGAHMHMRIPPAGSAVERLVEIVWCCLDRRRPVSPAQQGRRGPHRSLMQRFFCGTRRNGERWLVGIYKSMTLCRDMAPPQMVKLCADPRQRKHLSCAENAHAPVGAPAPCCCKCALILHIAFLIGKPYIILYRRVSYDRSCPVADHSLCGASPKPRGWRHAMFLFYF